MHEFQNISSPQTVLNDCHNHYDHIGTNIILFAPVGHYHFKSRALLLQELELAVNKKPVSLKVVQFFNLIFSNRNKFKVGASSWLEDDDNLNQHDSNFSGPVFNLQIKNSHRTSRSRLSRRFFEPFDETEFGPTAKNLLTFWKKTLEMSINVFFPLKCKFLDLGVLSSMGTIFWNEWESNSGL